MQLYISLRSLMAVFSTIFVMLILGACSIKSTGDVRDDTTLTGETQRLSKAGVAYTGPTYVIGILAFENKSPARVVGMGEAATRILRTQIEQAGLKAILLDKGELAERQKLISLQKSGALKTGVKRADQGFEAIDYRLSGAITAYSEVEEGIDALFYRKKSYIARVTVDYALVDIATGKALVSESGTGIYKKTTTGSLGLGAGSGYDPGLRDGALRDALARALNKMIVKLGNLPFRGKVILVDGKSVVIRAGKRSRLGQGTELTVYRLGKKLRDPDTGEVLGQQQTRIGVVRLVQHQSDRLSKTTIVSGNGFKPGDIVKTER